MDNQNVNGNYLITFENNTIIDKIVYENQNSQIWNYIKINNLNDIVDIIENNELNITLENINLLSIRKEAKTSNRISISLTTLITIFSITFIIFKVIKILKKRKQLKLMPEKEINLEEINKRIDEAYKDAGLIS